MRLDNDITQPGVRDPSSVLPRHFTNSYPDLVEFLEAYVDTLYKRMLRPDQVQALMNNEDWWDKKDQYFSTEDERLYNKVMALIEYRRRIGFQQDSVQLIERKSLERNFLCLNTLDNFVIETSDDRNIEVHEDNQYQMAAWLNDKGLTEIQPTTLGVDVPKIIKLARHLFKIRGSTFCAKLFFEALYGGTVYIELPREQMAKLDDNMVLDGTQKLRDDYYYDEFTYVINLVGSRFEVLGPQFYDLWKRKFHPGGFRCIFNVYSDYEWLLVSGNFQNIDLKINVWKEFFEGPFSLAMQDVQTGTL